MVHQSAEQLAHRAPQIGREAKYLTCPVTELETVEVRFTARCVPPKVSAEHPVNKKVASPVRASVRCDRT